MIDFHTHVLPGIDDGSKSVQMSLEMLHQSLEQGVTTLVATPHFYPHRETPDDFFRRREASVSVLLSQGHHLPHDLTLHLGCELHYYDGISRMEQLEQCCIQGTSTLLLEMPFSPWTKRMFAEISAIQSRGITPVIAHIERYFHLQNRGQMLSALAEVGAYNQVTASYFLGYWSGLQAMGLFRGDHIQVLGSDCHNLTSRGQNMGEAHQKLLRKFGVPQLEQWSHYGQQLLSGGRCVRSKADHL